MKELMLGNEAIARGAYEAGVKVASAYPGTPSTEITEYISTYEEIYSEWAPNEKVSLEVAIGASIGGGRAICAMKHVGLNVAADPLFTVSYTGVNAGLVICVADDQGMHSSQNEQDSRHYAAASKTLMLEPSDSAECKEFVKSAFELSEEYDTPVFIRLSTRIAHSRSLVEVCDREPIELKEYKKNPGKYVMMPAMARARHVIVEQRIEKLKELAEDCGLNRVELNGGKIGVITSGITYQYAKDALGDKASYLKLGMVYPLPEKLIVDFASKFEAVYVIEELDPYLETHCKALGLNVIGKEKFTLLGEYTSNMIKNVVLGEVTDVISVEEQIPNRPPVMCAGCPHRGLFHSVKQLGLTVSGDIGCYTLGALPPIQSIDTCVCMGASIGVAHGMEKVRGKEQSRKTVALIGDSTFVHSGITGLINVAYNKGTSTVVILDNSITGMTGHQQNPTTGKTITGEPTSRLDLEKLCHAIGIDNVSIIDPFDTEAMKNAIKEGTESDEPSVIISRRPCALLKSFVSHGVRTIKFEKCKGCGACLRIGCPAVIKDGEKVRINEKACAGCSYCETLCKFGAISRKDGE